MTLQPPPVQPPTYVVGIGNIHATSEYVVTPTGSWRLADTNVQTADFTTTTTHTPTWAVVLAVIGFFFFFLGLLFLLARESRTTGYLAVTVFANGQSYVEHIPVQSAAQKGEILARVGYLQNLIGQDRYRVQSAGGAGLVG